MRFDLDISCADSGEPYSLAFGKFIDSVKNLPDTPFATIIKCAICYNIRYATEKVIDENQEPTHLFKKILEEHTSVLLSMVGLGEKFTSLSEENFFNVENKVGCHYGNLFKAFDDDHYFNETVDLLKTRLSRNNFDFSYVDGKRALDAGCGGGRYTVALKKIGFKEVVGVDISEIGINDARKRIEKNKIEGVSFVVGSVLGLPFKDNDFDFVFSNGVLHHTSSISDGIKEMVRVLKPNGIGWLYLINVPGGIYWDMVDALRFLMKDVPIDLARETFRIMGVPTNKIFYMLDHVMVPINTKLTDEKIQRILLKCGAKNIKRLNRGTNFDSTERIYQSIPFAKEKYGVGQHRYFFSK